LGSRSLSPECIEEIAVFMEGIDTEEMDCDTCLIMQEILCDEIEDEELLDFAIDNLEELLFLVSQNHVFLGQEICEGSFIYSFTLIYIKTLFFVIFLFFPSSLSSLSLKIAKQSYIFSFTEFTFML
jgi:hypothetical protein